jgi:hypothetical protein
VVACKVCKRRKRCADASAGNLEDYFNVGACAEQRLATTSFVLAAPLLATIVSILLTSVRGRSAPGKGHSLDVSTSHQHMASSKDSEDTGRDGDDDRVLGGGHCACSAAQRQQKSAGEGAVDGKGGPKQELGEEANWGLPERIDSHVVHIEVRSVCSPGRQQFLSPWFVGFVFPRWHPAARHGRDCAACLPRVQRSCTSVTSRVSISCYLLNLLVGLQHPTVRSAASLPPTTGARAH